MITIEPPLYQIRGMTIFRDHENPDQFYYLPDRPQIARQGDGLAFALYKYRRDLTDNPSLEPTHARGAGIALFEVEIPAPRVAILEAELASRTGRTNVRLSPVLFRTSTVHAILARSPQDRLIEDLVETHRAPVSVPHHTAFALALTAEGATLFEQAARGGQVPVGVAYEMRFLALTPALHARVTMDYERIYDRFSASVGFTYYVSAKLDVDLAWLIEHDFIKIEITAYTDEADQRRQQQLIMDLVKLRIQQDFFRSGMPPEPQPGLMGPLGDMLAGLFGSSEITSASAFFVLKAKYEAVREGKTFELLYEGRSAVELTHVCTGFLSTMLPDGSAPVIREIDLDDDFFSSLDVEVSSLVDFDEMADLQETVVHLSFRDHRPSFPFSKASTDPQRFQVTLSDPRRDEYEWEVEYFFDRDLGTGESRLAAGPFTSRRRALVVNPLAHFRYRRVGVLLGPIDLDLVPRLRVQLRVRDDENVTLARSEIRLDAQQREQLWRVHLPLGSSPLRVFARVDWEDPNGDVHEGEEEEVTGDRFVALGPYREILRVNVQPAVDWTQVTFIHVELRYQDGDHVVHRDVRFTSADGLTPRTITIPIRDRTKRTYEWSMIAGRLDGQRIEVEWTPSDRTLLLVPSERERFRDVQVEWLGSPGAALALQIDFRVATANGGDDWTGSALLRAGQDRGRKVRVLLDPDGRLRYRYQIKRITAQGIDVIREGEGLTDILPVQS